MVADANQLAVCDVVVRIQGFEQQLPAAFVEVRAWHDFVALFWESRQGQDVNFGMAEKPEEMLP